MMRLMPHNVMGSKQAVRLTIGLSLVLGVSAGQAANETIQISGSSTVYPITKAAIEDFQSSGNERTSFELRETGSSAGFREFCSGNIPLANASRPISSKELKRCKKNGIRFIELPVAFDAITVAVNPANTWSGSMTVKELQRLWNKKAQGRINRWNQINLDYPDSKIKLCGPGKESGTFDVFNKTINGSKKNSRTDYLASEDDNKLVKCVSENKQALAYFGFSYYKNNANKLRAVKIVNPKGNPVAPGIQNVQNEKYRPLSRPLFLYVNDQQLRANKTFRRFVSHYLRNMGSLVKRTNYIPLPESTYRLVDSKLYRHVLGTSFGGDLPVGLTIGQAIDRSFDQHKKPRHR
jgi:phosphate transport system substrate-binding protein